MKPTVISSEIAHTNPWYSVRHDELIWANGKPGHYYVAEFPGAVCLVCVRDAHILTIEQYRHPIGRTSRELPTGRLNPRETPEEAAQRELLEETGFHASRQTFLGKLWMLNGAAYMPLHVYLMEATGEAGKQTLDDAETGLVASWMTFSEWRHAIRTGTVHDGESIAAWCLYTEWLASQKES